MADDRSAVAVAAVPGRRKRTLELAREIERRGFAGMIPSSAAGNQLVAFEELLAAFA